MAFFGKLPKFNSGMKWEDISADQFNNLVEVVETLRRVIDSYNGSAGSGGLFLSKILESKPTIEQRPQVQGLPITLAKFKSYGTAGGFNIIKVRRIDSAGNETDTTDQDCWCYAYGNGLVDVSLTNCWPKLNVDDIVRVYQGTRGSNIGLVCLIDFINTCT